MTSHLLPNIRLETVEAWNGREELCQDLATVNTNNCKLPQLQTPS